MSKLKSRDQDFEDMEQRPGGGGAGSIVWALGLLLFSVAIFAAIRFLR